MTYEVKFNPKQVMSRYKNGIQVWKSQRDRETKALAFMVPENQWTQEAKNSRNGSSIGGQAVPARPCLSISKIDQPIQLVQNQFQNAHLGVNIHPLSEKANKETAEILQGLYRKIERDSNAVLPRSWAFDRATEAGTGVYRVVTEYDDTTDDPWDQKILIKRILRQDMVIFDPSANEPDYSDAQYAFVSTWVPIDTFRRDYPKSHISKLDDSELQAISNEQPEWVRMDGDEWGVIVAEYFCKHYEPIEHVTTTSDGQTLRRTEQKVRLMWSKVAGGGKDGIEELESQEWNGQYIPLIIVVGKEMQPYDKERRYVGIVEPAMDAQRGYNYSVTTAIEIAALEPKAPFIGAEGQFEGHESKWNQANVRNWPYMEYAPKTLDGNLLPPPQRMPIDASRLNVSMTLAGLFDQAIQATTFTPDPALGKHSRDESGKAIEALQSQSQASTSNFMANMAQISMTYEAKVIMDMIPRIYDRPGRIARILDAEDGSSEVMLNQPFIVDQASGRPVAVNQDQGIAQMGAASPMTTSGAAPMPQPNPQPRPKVYNLTEGKYGVAISIGKSYPTRIEQGKETLLSVFQVAPQTVPILLPLLMKYSDEPWAQDAFKLLKKARDKEFPDLDTAEPGEETPEQLRAQLDAAKAKIQQAEQLMAQMKQAIETDAEKQKATIEKARIDAEAKMALAAQDAQTKAQLEELTQKFDAMLEQMKEQSAAELQAMNNAHEMRMLELEQRFAALQAAEQREHEAELAEENRKQAEAERSEKSDD